MTSSSHEPYHRTKHNECTSLGSCACFLRKLLAWQDFPLGISKVTRNSLGKVNLLFKITNELQKENERHYNGCLIWWETFQNLDVNS